MATISVKALKVEAIIGIYPHELHQTQPLIFDIDMVSDISPAAASDNIEHALDYAGVASRVKAMAEGNSRKLLESLIEDIAEQLMREFSAIEELSLAVSKPQAIAEADCARIAVVKRRSR